MARGAFGLALGCWCTFAGCQLILPLDEVQGDGAPGTGGRGGSDNAGGTSGAASGGKAGKGGSTSGAAGDGGDAGTGAEGGSAGTGGASGGASGSGGGGPCDCGGTSPICESASGDCRACEDHAECEDLDPAAPFCLASGACGECEVDATCPVASPVCDAGSCRGCRDNSECDSDACNSATGRCIEADSSVYALAETGVGMPCGTQAAPCRTLADAASQLTAVRSNLVMVPTGAAFNLGTTLPVGFPVRVVGNNVAVEPYTSATGFTVGSGHVTFDTVVVRGSNATGAAGILCDGGRIVVENSLLENNLAGISTDTCEIVVRGSTLRMNEIGVGVLTAAPVPVTIEQNTIDGNAQALYLQGDPLVVQNNLFLRNGTDNYTRVIEFRHETGVPFFGFNTLVGNFNNCIYIGIVACNGSGSPVLASNITWDNFPSFAGMGDDCLSQVFQGCGSMTNTIAERAWPGTGNSTDDPLFVDATNDDYHLQSNSPAIDSGAHADAPEQDYYGISRPQGGAPDIGAIEYVP